MIKSRILKTEKIRWRELQAIQSDSFKELSKKDYDKLKLSLIKNDFIMPFAVWQDQTDEKIYSIDGLHRKKVLEMIEADGGEVPEVLDANFIDCVDRKEASKLLLLYSSIYAKVTKDGFYEFLNKEMLDFEVLKFEVDLPNIDANKFEKEYIKDERSDAEEQRGRSMFEVVIECENEAQQEDVFNDLYERGYKCRLLTY